ncbi:SNARE-like superfamily protein [Prunus dulcis]|uniref:Trafficking protein particle complex subunit n=1 Tax=Prunus dulcis TaxID=3755 RepID=A0A4Y1RRL8_PRUDU|nr:SNARE-like superfamily protein [Prunus dulcis]
MRFGSRRIRTCIFALNIRQVSNGSRKPTGSGFRTVFRVGSIYSGFIAESGLKDYGSSGRMDTNDSLRVASLWHSMHAISQQLSPISGCFGIELLQADTFDLHCFQSLTGTKFFVVCEPGTQHMEGLLKHIYELYTDYVLKNPFYEMEMPIRCELFDINLTQAIQKDRVALLAR